MKKKPWMAASFGAKIWRIFFLTYDRDLQSNFGCEVFNRILEAFLNAYNHHGDIKVTPCDIWITIMLYFSQYINDNAEALR